MRNKRKLIRYDIFKELIKKSADGVPFTKLVRDYNLDITSQHLSTLIKQHEAISDAERQFNPTWLGGDKAIIQEPPEHIQYQGLFPFGRWLLRTVDIPA